MTKNDNIIGEKFGKWLVIKQIASYKRKRMYLCRCECGNFKNLNRQMLAKKGQCIDCIRYVKKPKKDFTNQKSGFLTALYAKRVKASEKSRNVYEWRWVCRCDCGNIKEISSQSFSKTKSCGCKYSYFQKSGRKNVQWKGYEDISLSLWARWKHRAKKANCEFSIKIEDVWDTYIKQNKKCALTGINIDFGNMNIRYEDRKCTASLDRIDSSRGYSIDNIQLVHKSMNFIKSNFNEKSFYHMCKAVYLSLKDKYDDEEVDCLWTRDKKCQ